MKNIIPINEYIKYNINDIIIVIDDGTEMPAKVIKNYGNKIMVSFNLDNNDFKNRKVINYSDVLGYCVNNVDYRTSYKPKTTNDIIY